jgi:hypothetical protein
MEFAIRLKAAAITVTYGAAARSIVRLAALGKHCGALLGSGRQVDREVE